MRDTLECLSSLRKIDYSPYQVLLVDNGSSDETVDSVKKHFPEVQILENGENLGFAEGNNRGIKFALNKGAEAVLILNNDTVVDRNMLKAFAESYHPKTLLGAKVYRADKPDHFDHLGGNWNENQCEFDLVGLDDLDTRQYDSGLSLDYITGCALFAPANLFHEIGFFEPTFFLFWEEADLCFRALKQGYTCKLTPSAKLWHKGSASFVGGKPHTTYYWWRNRLLYMKRNLPPSIYKEKMRTVIHPQKRKFYKLLIIKAPRLWLFKLLRMPHKRQQQKISQYKAACRGIHDYLSNRFGSAPPSIFK